MPQRRAPFCTPTPSVTAQSASACAGCRFTLAGGRASGGAARRRMGLRRGRHRADRRGRGGIRA